MSSYFLASDLLSWLRVAFIGWVVTTESYSSKVPPVTFKTIVVTFILGVADKGLQYSGKSKQNVLEK